MPTLSSRTTFKYRRFFTILPLSMLFQCWFGTRLYRGNSFASTWWYQFGPWLFQCFSHHLTSSWCGPSSNETIPEAILESARIDGASEARIFFQICLPLSLPGIATITLFTALGFWNDWFNALLYIKSDNLVSIAIFAWCKSKKYGLHR